MQRILVIDDSCSILQFIELALIEAGHEARTCRDGNSALEALKRERFDLIITDIYMPDKDGIAIILEEQRTDPDLPIIAVSGMTERYSVLSIANYLGACQVLQKPFSKTSLLAAVDTALGRNLSGTSPLPNGGRFKAWPRRNNGA